MVHLRRLIALLAFSLGLSACGAGGNPASLAPSRDGEWARHGFDLSETRFSPLDQINIKTVSGLKLAWFYDLDTNRGQESTPIMAGGRLYTTSAWSKVQAFDAASGKLLWTFDPKVPGETAVKGCCDVVNRGAAVEGNKLFFATLDGRLIALDTASGKMLWSTLTVDQSKSYTITGAPRLVKGKVIIGNGGAEYGVRGYVSAYDMDSGKLAWRFYTVPGKAGEKDRAASDDALATIAGPTWKGKPDDVDGGGTVWDSMAYDPDLDLLYIGVGNGSPWNQAIRSPGGGDNLFLSSIVALRPSTGQYIWHYQTTPGDQWDYTASQHMILTDLVIGGKNRKVLMQAPKNGFFYVIDRTDGKLISADGYVPQNWTTGVDMATGRPKMNPAARYGQTGKPWLATPGFLGGHNWHPMAFSPQTGLVYIPANEIGAPPITFSVAGKQYVSVVVGWGGVYPLLLGELAKKSNDRPNRSRVLTFSLDGKASLPEEAQAALSPFVPPASFGTPDQIARGRTIYARSCGGCHGDGVRSGGVLPELRQTGAMTDAEVWKSIVIDGALSSGGMVGFSKDLTPQDAEAVRAYVVMRANE